MPPDVGKKGVSSNSRVLAWHLQQSVTVKIETAELSQKDRLQFLASSPHSLATISVNMKAFSAFVVLIPLLFVTKICLSAQSQAQTTLPHIIFVMADDMGWGQTGYRNHPILKTPNIDAMAANGLRFDRFYAGGPVCSPTRASVLTGRTHDRTGVLSHGYALRLQERTIAQALKARGYITAHFGKWHLNGQRGPGAPIFGNDPRSPSAFGFDTWLSVSNFYDMDPLLSRNGNFEAFKGDSSDVIMHEATQFLRANHDKGKPMFAVIWYGTPHSPFRATEADKSSFANLNEPSANHYGELVALDRSLGNLRSTLKELEIAENTLLVFCSDNGGLPEIKPDTVGGLRGHKGSVYEGGIRVPGIFEWPSVIQPAITDYPACVTDLFPTIADIVDLTELSMLRPIDGISLQPLFGNPDKKRSHPIGFRYQNKRAWIDNRYKLVTNDVRRGKFELYDLVNDPRESHDLSSTESAVFDRLKTAFESWDQSVDGSFTGTDYPEEAVSPPDPNPINWFELPQYAPFLEQWSERWEYQRYLRRPSK